MKLTPLQKRAERRSRNQTMVDMNLVSLIDVFTILIFFLLSSSGNVETLPSPKAVLLPESRLALHYRPMPKVAPGALAAAVDRSSGLSTPEHLVEVLRRDWSIAQRDARNLTVMRFDLDGCRDLPEDTDGVPSGEEGSYGCD